MGRLNWLRCLWPGLTRLGSRGEWLALSSALVFAGLLQVAVPGREGVVDALAARCAARVRAGLGAVRPQPHRPEVVRRRAPGGGARRRR